MRGRDREGAIYMEGGGGIFTRDGERGYSIYIGKEGGRDTR